MNYGMILSVIGKISKAESILLLLPVGIALLYRESQWSSFLLVAAILMGLGFLLNIKKPKSTVVRESEGFVIVAISWILVSLFGALPFTISGEIPSYIDAIFETVSGFTTTGATILTNFEGLSQGALFWRSFTHWVGGMGIIVFVLAFLPKSEGRSIHIMRAEVPGPVVGKIVSKIKNTAIILYAIYLGLSIIQVILLLLGGMPLFDSVVHMFGTAGTGGFSIKNISIAAYNSPYLETVITVFMAIFGMNFTIFYLILTGHVLQALRSEELRWYLVIILVAIFAIALNILPMYDGFFQALRFASFQVSSIITTTGYSTTNFDLWPSFSKSILVILMFFGACAGSTAGGLKIARLVIMEKASARELKRLVHPRSVVVAKSDGKPIDPTVIHSTAVYFIIYMVIFMVSVLFISLDKFDLISNFSAVTTCFNNVGPGLAVVGPLGSFAQYSDFSKLLFSLDMLLGRLEIYPILMLFSPATWRRS